MRKSTFNLNNFRFVYFVILAACMSIPTDSPCAKQMESVLQAKIWTDHRGYSDQDDIPIHFQISNVSSRDVLIGKDLWGSMSPGRVHFIVLPKDGHAVTYLEWAADGLAPHAFADFPLAVVKWCLALSPGYSYETTIPLRQFVNGLRPGIYTIQAKYSSRGVGADKYFNPLLVNPDERAKFAAESWSGEIVSNEISIRITPKSK